MSTRSTTHFIYTEKETGKRFLGAIIYRHSDGYPKGAGVDLFKFLGRCRKLDDSRFTDPSYLASRYVVFLGEMFAADSNSVGTGKGRKYVYTPRTERLNFISVGVMMSDPFDIEYRY